MTHHPVEKQIEIADRAIVAEDFDTLLDIYTDDAVLVVKPGTLAVGKEQLLQAFQRIAVYFQNGLQVTQNGMEIIEAGSTALVVANTIVSGPDYPAVERKATYVFVKAADDVWRCSIDNSYGHDIIGVNTD
ncbi:MAG: SgcJ/EcaC family oxidoreductase [Wenzhouxiangellaceae bacterium]